MTLEIQKGFYYHYKHNPEVGKDNYAYEILGLGQYTEGAYGTPENTFVVYRPLYESAPVYTLGKMFDIRPLSMFKELVEQNGHKIPRFRKIEDGEIIDFLQKKRAEMYGDEN